MLLVSMEKILIKPWGGKKVYKIIMYKKFSFFYCVSLQSNDVLKSILANGKNCLEVKQGEVALTESSLHELNLNFGDIVEIIQVSPVAPLEPSYVVVKISGGEVFRQDRQLSD